MWPGKAPALPDITTNMAIGGAANSGPGKHTAIVSTASGLVNLNTLIPSDIGFTLTDSVGINDSGQILCDATNASGHEHAVLLSPK